MEEASGNDLRTGNVCEIPNRLKPRPSTFTHGPSNGLSKSWLCCDKPLADFLAPIFERLFDKRHELVGNGAVNQAVVVAQR